MKNLEWETACLVPITEDRTRLYSTHSEIGSCRRSNIKARGPGTENSTKDWNWYRIRKRILVKDWVWISWSRTVILVRKDGSTYRRSYYACHFRTYVLFILNRMSRLRYEMNENVKFKMTRIRKIPARLNWLNSLFIYTLGAPLWHIILTLRWN